MKKKLALLFSVIMILTSVFSFAAFADEYDETETIETETIETETIETEVLETEAIESEVIESEAAVEEAECETEEAVELMAAKITTVSVQLPKPVDGNVPSFDPIIPAGAGYKCAPGFLDEIGMAKNGVCWNNYTKDATMDINGGRRFDERYSYVVSVSLAPKDGYTWDTDNLKVSFNGVVAERSSLGEDIDKDLTYRIMPDGMLDINCIYHTNYKVTSATVKIPAPVIGKKPSYDMTIPEGEMYQSDWTGDGENEVYEGVGWEELVDGSYVELPKNAVFRAGGTYRVTLYLHCFTDIQFGGTIQGLSYKLPVTINGITETGKTWASNKSSLYVSHEFTPLKPGKVTGVTADSASISSIKLSWSKVSGASGYKIYRASSKAGTYKLIDNVKSGSTLTYKDSGRTTGKTYYYKVRAYAFDENAKYCYGSYSTVVSGKALPSKVTGLKAEYASSTSIKLTWSKVSGADGYAIYSATSKDGKYAALKAIKSGSTLSYTNTKLTKNKTYYYKVKAYKLVNGEKVYGPYSSVVYKKCGAK